MSIDLKKLEIRKEQVINLTKSLGIENEKAEVVLALDFSGSMSGLFSNGAIQELIERILPLALKFDDDGKIPVYLFSNSFIKVKQSVTLQDIDGIAQRIYSSYSNYMSGTSYAPVIDAIVSDYKPGLFKSKLDIPVYVIFITDGSNSDVEQAKKAIRNASSYGIFFQTVGIGSSSFPMLETLDTLSGRKIDNANFFAAKNLSTISDSTLYNQLLFEFPSFIKEARTQGLIK